jgi:probable phosphoglycerate mutase
VLSLYLLRHGETEFSRDDRFCGRIDAQLTDVGREMAACFADVYGKLSWRAVFTSGRQRAISTAEPLATQAALPIHHDAGLDEIDYGAWQGRCKDEVLSVDRERYRRWCEDPTVNAPGGESVGEVRDRVRSSIERIGAQYDDGNVLVVSHKTALRVLICSLLGIELSRFRDRIAQPVAGVSVVELAPSGPLLRCLGDLGHLPPRLRALAAAHAIPSDGTTLSGLAARADTAPDMGERAPAV